MIILRENNAKEVNEKLKAGKYNGYAYIQVAKKLKPGHERILRIGETGISKNGLTTYRPVRGIREWKQADGKQTNLLDEDLLARVKSKSLVMMQRTFMPHVAPDSNGVSRQQ